MKALLSSFTLIFLSVVSLFAQPDSLKLRIAAHATLDSTLCDLYMQLADSCVRTDAEIAATYADSAIIIGKLINDPTRLALAYEVAGNALWYKSDYYQSIAYSKQAISILEGLKDTAALGNNYNALGLNYTFLSQYEIALEFTLKALAIAEVQHDSVGQIILYSNVGDLYRQLGDPQKSLTYQERAAQFNKAPNIPIYNGIIAYCTGFAYQDLADHQAALTHYKTALDIGKEIQFKELIHRTLNNKSQILLSQNRYNAALVASKEALAIAESMKSKRGKTLSLLNIGQVLHKMKEYTQAELHFKQALSLSISGNMDALSRDIYEATSELYYSKKDYKKSLENRKQYEQLKDSIFTLEKSKQIAEVQALYQTAKKEKEIEQLEHQQDLDKAMIRQQRAQNIALITVFLVAALVGVNIYRNRQRLKQANLLLNAKNREINTQNEELIQQAEEIKSQRDFIEQQKNLLSDKNKMMTDSIRYAQTIQEALLPFKDKLAKSFAAYGIVYRPKDIVSGDFYWYEEIENKKFISVFDCTGHGVPGAFMSIIGLSLLNDEVVKRKLDNPAQILINMHRTVQRILKQEQSENLDGMDIGLCVIEEQEDKLKLTYSGAKRPLYYIQKGSKKLNMLRGDRKSIGGIDRKEFGSFTNQEIILQKGDTLYLTTDGYADQHNKKGRKFGSLQLEKLLEWGGSRPMDQQITKIEEVMDNFMLNQDQRDDITILAIKL